MKKHEIQVRSPDGAVVETVRRVLRAETIGNFCSIYCTYKGCKSLVRSDAPHLDDPFRGVAEDHYGKLYIVPMNAAIGKTSKSIETIVARVFSRRLKPDMTQYKGWYSDKYRHGLVEEKVVAGFKVTGGYYCTSVRGHHEYYVFWKERK